MGYGSNIADNQLIDWQQQLQKFPRIYGTGWGYGPAPVPTGTAKSVMAGASPWGGFNFGAVAPSTATGSTSGLPLLTTSKSPAGNAALEATLARVSSLSNDPNQPVFTTIKDPAQAARIAATGGQFDTATGQGRERLADFTANFFNAAPEAKRYTDQETGAIGEYYGPASDPNSVTASLNRLLNQRRQAVAGSLQRALNQSVRRGNINRLGLGGDSSYNNQQFMDTAAGIMSGEAATEAELNRNNYLAVKDAQARLAGQRSGLLQNYLTRDLIPIEANQRFLSSTVGNLGALGNVTNANNLYQTPEQLQSARLGLLGQYGADLNALNIFGVGGNFPSPAANWGNPNRGLGPIDYSGFGGGLTLDARTGQVVGGGGGGTSQTRGMLPAQYANADPVTRAAAMQYYQASGVWPNQDVNYSPELWNWARGQVAGMPRPNTGTTGNVGLYGLDYASQVVNGGGGGNLPGNYGLYGTDYGPPMVNGAPLGYGLYGTDYGPNVWPTAGGARGAMIDARRAGGLSDADLAYLFGGG